MLAPMNDSATDTGVQTNAAIFYQPEGYDTSRQKLMGRHAAGEGFLKGFLRHSGVDTLYCYAATKEYAGHFQRLVGNFGNKRPVRWLDERDAASPRGPGTLYLPDPSLAAAAWRRRGVGQRLYSITGITHTTASAGAMDWISGLLSAPVQNWDALICTSRVVRDTIELVLDQQQEYLKERMGAAHFTRPQLPVIPLGVDTEAFAPVADKRDAARAALGLGPDDIAVLFVGRLSFHAKAHPLPMYLGLERAAQALAKSGKRKIHLIQAGWFANDFIENAFKNGAAQFCPSVKAVFLDGRKPDLRTQAWAAADLFTSLSDNFQETFGLTPIEAMAAGLPGVVSDWNGYKDTVRDGVDGLRVPTLMPRGGLGADLADRHAAGIDTYDLYCGFSSQFVAIDPSATARAYLKLIEDDDLRRRMGAAARRQAVENFDWASVVKRYQALWHELGALRAAGAENAPRQAGEPGNPARLDPFISFATYPSDVLSDQHIVAVTQGADGARLQALLQSPLISFVKPVAPDADDCARILADLQRRGPVTVADILADAPDTRRDRIERGLVWLAKLGLLSIKSSTR
jgi:glycosyltransferase involved in cell wall biosynthesis